MFSFNNISFLVNDRIDVIKAILIVLHVKNTLQGVFIAFLLSALYRKFPFFKLGEKASFISDNVSIECERNCRCNCIGIG